MAAPPDLHRVRVMLRCRPANKEELRWFNKCEHAPILRDETRTPNPETRMIVDATNKSYTYDRVYRDEANNRQLFRDAVVPTLESVFEGYCGAVMCYGQTGTGKTFTMQGYGGDKGMIPHAFEYIFERIEKQSRDYSFTVSMSFIQIYLDKLQDLFSPEADEVRINPEGDRVELPGITSHTVTSAEELHSLYHQGEKHRVTRATKMNPTSSRGHAAVSIEIKSHPRRLDLEEPTRIGKLVLVDLAGYERFSETGVTSGIAAEEAKKINASLLALGSVVNALADAARHAHKRKHHVHIPYRNSKLTMLLRDCLGGTSKSTIVLTMGPCDKYQAETAGTLYFGWRAMAVKVDATISEEYDPAKYLENLKSKVAQYKARIKTFIRFVKSIGQWDAYVAKYGVPEVQDDEQDSDDDEDHQDFLASLGVSQRNVEVTPTESPNVESQRGSPTSHETLSPTHDDTRANLAFTTATARALGKFKGAITRRRGMAAMTWQELAADSSDDDDADSYAELRNLKKRSNEEFKLLRMRQLQDIKEAKRNGASPAELEKLREAHEQELVLMREQHRLLKKELTEKREREKAEDLLVSARDAILQEYAQRGTTTLGKDKGRVEDMCRHLTQTCDTRDEVIVRLLDLICYYEHKLDVNDLDTILAAQLQAECNDSRPTTLAEAARQDQRLRAELGLLKMRLAECSCGVSDRMKPIPATPFPMRYLSREEICSGVMDNVKSSQQQFQGRAQSPAGAPLGHHPAPAQSSSSPLPDYDYEYEYTKEPATPPKHIDRGSLTSPVSSIPNQSRTSVFQNHSTLHTSISPAFDINGHRKSSLTGPPLRLDEEAAPKSTFMNKPTPPRAKRPGPATPAKYQPSSYQPMGSHDSSGSRHSYGSSVHEGRTLSRSGSYTMPMNHSLNASRHTSPGPRLARGPPRGRSAPVTPQRTLGTPQRGVVTPQRTMTPQRMPSPGPRTLVQPQYNSLGSPVQYHYVVPTSRSMPMGLNQMTQLEYTRRPSQPTMFY